MKAHYLQTFLTFAAASLLLFSFYSGLILEPNSHAFSELGDGIKNYYACLYHAFFSDDCVMFTGMNYPYYEHMIYTDAMPIIGWILMLLSSPENGVGFLNLLILFSIPLTAVFLFLILRAQSVNVIWSMAAGITLSFLAPQIDRFGGHLGLSFVFLIPCYWWILIKYECAKQLIWLWLAMFVATASFLIHPYMGLILSATGVLYFGLRVLVHQNRIKSFLGMLIAGGIPIIAFRLFMWLSDPQSDRESTGQGFFEYYGNFESLLHPRWPESLYYKILDWGVERQPWESQVYLGFSTLLFLFAVGVYHIHRSRNSIKKLVWSHFGLAAFVLTGLPALFIALFTGFSFRGLLEFLLVFTILRSVLTLIGDQRIKPLKIFVLAASILMLFGMCIPFKYGLIRPIVEHLGTLSEFRSLGRFLWVIYYALGIASVTWFYHKFSNKRIVAVTLFIVGFSVSGSDLISRHQRMSYQIEHNENPFKFSNKSSDYLSLMTFLTKNNPNALLCLPFFHAYGSQVNIEAEATAMKTAFLLSYHTSTSLLNMHSARIPAEYSKKMLQLFTPSFIDKMIYQKIPEDDLVYIVVMRDYEVPEEQISLVQQNSLIFENLSYQVYKLDLSILNNEHALHSILNDEQNAIHFGNQIYPSQSDSIFIYHEDYEQLKSSTAFRGQGALAGQKAAYNVIAEIDASHLPPSTYEASFYYYLADGVADRVACLEANYIDGSKLWVDMKAVAESYFTNGDWGKVDLQIETTSDMKSVKVMLTGRDSQEPFIVDELLIIKEGGPAVIAKAINSEGSIELIYNNYWIPLSENESKR